MFLGKEQCKLGIVSNRSYVFLFYISNMALHLMLIKFKSCFKTAFKLFILHVYLYFLFKNKGKLCKGCHIIL